MKSTSFDSMIISSSNYLQSRGYSSDLIDRSQLKSVELELEKFNEERSKKKVLQTIKDITRMRKAKKFFS